MDNLGNELSDRLIEIIRKINPLGRDGTHTQHTDEFSNMEVESVEDAILDLYALILLNIFRYTGKYIFITSSVTHVFILATDY